MENLQNQKTAFYLFKKERIYRDKTLTSLYFKSNKEQVEKKSCPIDIDGVRYKLNKVTGELGYYTKSEVLNSMACSLRRTKIALNMLLEMNDFDWFATLTFDRQKIDRTNDKLVYDTYVKYINNVKHQYPSFRYITVPERHEDGCIHFHLLIGGLTPKQLGLVNSGKVCCSWAYYKNKIVSREFFERTKDKHELTDTDGLPIYNVTSFPYGLTTVSRIVSRARCNSYVKKYMDKDLGKSTEIFKKRFFYSKNLNVPAIVEQLIGADFEAPKNLQCILANDPHLLNADFTYYNKDHNILQYWEENAIKKNIDSGLIPLSDAELESLENSTTKGESYWQKSF